VSRYYVELTVGAFMLLGLVCLGYLSVRFAREEVISGDGYRVEAVFSNVGGLRGGAPVTMAGVEVGRVAAVELADYAARVTLRLDEGVKLPEDSIASVKTRGLIGEKFVAVSPGAAESMIEAGGRIRETEAAINLESLISRYAFGEVE
jgi:phospholipid/cholesterol/gamma-HCH transport system substrate-binding protein